MTHTRVSDLRQVTEAVFQKEFRSLRPLFEAEAELQKQLARLDAQLHQVRQECAATAGYRTTGTDILWNGWESATRRELNMELARLRAQKLTALETLRKAFGRKRAVEELSETMQVALRHKRAKRHST